MPGRSDWPRGRCPHAAGSASKARRRHGAGWTGPRIGSTRAAAAASKRIGPRHASVVELADSWYHGITLLYSLPMDFITFDPEEVYQAVRERALAEGAFTLEAWEDMIDAVLQDKEEFGEVHKDEDLSAVKEDLKARFEEFKAENPGA